jgi:hypothetical protein
VCLDVAPSGALLDEKVNEGQVVDGACVGGLHTHDQTVIIWPRQASKQASKQAYQKGGLVDVSPIEEVEAKVLIDVGFLIHHGRVFDLRV